MRQILIVTAVAALFAAPAMADQAAAVRQVAFNDLNLSTAAGRHELDRRIDRAARSICATNPVTDTQAVAEERARCIAATTEAARQQVTAAISAQGTQTVGL